MTKIKLKIEREYDVKFLKVDAGVRYWEDGTVNEVQDEEGTLMPFRDGDRWTPTIDIEEGKIIDWPEGTTAFIHYKVCDDGIYKLLDANEIEIVNYDGYVPDCMSPEENGYGDYIIMKVDDKGFIKDWDPDFRDMVSEDE